VSWRVVIIHIVGALEIKLEAANTLSQHSITEFPAHLTEQGQKWPTCVEQMVKETGKFD